MQAAQLDGLLDKDKCQVFLFTCPATLPFSFSPHPWFIVNQKGTISRWEIFWWPEKQWNLRWGHLHKDFYQPLEGIPLLFFLPRLLWPQHRLLGYIEGGDDSIAARMADTIMNSFRTYPYCHQYLLRGPNSNSYVQWVLDKFPDSGLRLPWNAFGKAAARKTV
ncbi:DUF3750 domain-containing protein [Candidatus Kaiserbacteria bacterium]|nr:DUF3750 domain-containing protein [Candidatus Kaiserbacteria bacterium]